MTTCERCGAKAQGFVLFDYCAGCCKNLCPHCATAGCCGRVPMESGMAQEICPTCQGAGQCPNDDGFIGPCPECGEPDHSIPDDGGELGEPDFRNRDQISYDHACGYGD